MRGLLLVTLAVLATANTQADLQSVEIGGELRIRFRHFGDVLAKGSTFGSPSLGRTYGPYGYATVPAGDLSFVEQRTVLNVHADFTQEVAAFIEFESYDMWGEDFRSNWVSGADARAAGRNDLGVYQSYIDLGNLGGAPLRLRIGRQELAMGKSWLVGSRISATRGISYDGVRLTYDTDALTVDAWWTKLAENSALARDDDTDFYDVYGTYKALDAVSLSAYWLFIRDGRSGRTLDGARVSDLFGWDSYDPSEMHTVGFRAWGISGPWDYDLEMAYQFGEADAVGALFTLPVTGRGDDRARYDGWAADVGLGYSFDVRWSPRVTVAVAYFSGEDNRDVSLLEWLNPLRRPEASVSFNRITSGVWYGLNTDILGGSSSLSNFHQVRAALDLKPRENIETGLRVAYYGVNEPFSRGLWAFAAAGDTAPSCPTSGSGPGRQTATSASASRAGSSTSIRPTGGSPAVGSTFSQVARSTTATISTRTVWTCSAAEMVGTLTTSTWTPRSSSERGDSYATPRGNVSIRW